MPYVEPGPTPPVPSATWYPEIHAPAIQSLERLKSLLGNVLQLKYIDLEPAIVGLGVAVGFGDTDFVVLSVGGGDSANRVSVNCGVLRDVRQDRLLVLHECNRLTQDNPAYPFFLHDAEIGWDVLLSVTLPLQVVLDSPPFLGGLVRNLPDVAAEGRAQLLGETIAGVPYRWAKNDLQRLLLRSLM